MPLSEREELELLELEEKERGSLQLGEGKATGIRAPYPSEKFAQWAEPISQFAGMFSKAPLIGPVIAGTSTMGAEIARQGLQAVGGEPGTPATVLQSGGRIAKAFGRGALGEFLARGVFKGAAAIGRKSIPTGAQLMKISAGINEQTGKRVLADPRILSRALPIKEAGEKYGQVLEAAGLRQGPEVAMEFMGKSALTQEGAAGFAFDAIKKIKTGELTYQEALIARDQLKEILKMPKWQNPAVAANERFLISMRNQLDAYLEPYFQEAGGSFARARKDYSEAMMKKEFSSWLPTNANKTASVLRGTLALGAAGAGAGGYISPEQAAAGIALTSPRIFGYGIRAAASPITKKTVELGVRAITQTGAGQLLPSSTQELLRKRYEAQR